MMKKGILFLSMFFSAPLYAQSVSVLFPPGGQLTGVVIPFEVSSTAGSVEVVDVQTKNNTAECKTLIDPYRPEIFHAKCTKEGSVEFIVSYREGGRAKSLVLPSFAVTAPSGVVVGPVDPGVDPDIAAGKALSDSYCIGCHGLKTNASSAKIRGAINTEGQMKYLNGVLTNSDIDKIAKYLESL